MDGKNRAVGLKPSDGRYAHSARPLSDRHTGNLAELTLHPERPPLDEGGPGRYVFTGASAPIVTSRARPTSPAASARRPSPRDMASPAHSEW